MAKFRDRKKRVALAMGLASLLGASKMASAAGNNAGKAIGITTAILLGVGGTYEALADTLGIDKEMPSALKALGVIKSKKDRQKVDPELQKKINNALKNQDQKGGNKDEDEFEIIEDADENGSKANESFVTIESNVPIESNVLKNDGNVDAEKNFHILNEALGNYGMNKELLSGDNKASAISKLVKLAFDLKLERKSYGPLDGRDKFLTDVAHKIGLKGVSDKDMLKICSHNYADVYKDVNSKNLTKEQKDRLLALGRLRNMIAYDCGAGAASKINIFAEKGERRPYGLPDGFFKEKQ